MKVTLSVGLFLAALAATHCYPAEKDDGRIPTDVDFVPLEERRSGPSGFPGGVVDVDASEDGFFGNPFTGGNSFIGNPFPSLLNSIEAMMARMRQQLSQILGRLPGRPGESPFPELHIPNVGDIDLTKGNTTSVTKIIDGHKVTINETEYKQGDNNSASFFKVRIIDVHPDEVDLSTEKNAETVPPPRRDREDIEETVNNEIPKLNEEINFENIETFDESDLVPPYGNIPKNVDLDHHRPVESVEDNSIDGGAYHDLSNDIYVNELLANGGARPNPDAELFEVVNGQRVAPLLNYGYPRVNEPTNYPQSDFEQAGIHYGGGSRPAYLPQPYLYYSPPSYPLNNRFHFDIPVQDQNPAIPTYPVHKNYLPARQNTLLNQEEAISSNKIPQQPNTYSAAPSTST